MKEGQEVKVKVLSVDPDAHRLALSIKALQDRPAGSSDASEGHEGGNNGNQERRRSSVLVVVTIAISQARSLLNISKMILASHSAISR